MSLPAKDAKRKALAKCAKLQKQLVESALNSVDQSAENGFVSIGFRYQGIPANVVQRVVEALRTWGYTVTATKSKHTAAEYGIDISWEHPAPVEWDEPPVPVEEQGEI